MILTPEPIGPEDDATLTRILGSLSALKTRTRAVPLGLLRVNLGQEALAFALAPGPDRLFGEPEALADLLLASSPPVRAVDRGVSGVFGGNARRRPLPGPGRGAGARKETGGSGQAEAALRRIRT